MIQLAYDSMVMSLTDHYVLLRLSYQDLPLCSA